MTTIKEKTEASVKQALDIETKELFPAIYEGYKEIEALAQGEDAILEIIKKEIYHYFQNRNLQTMSVKAIEEFETGLRITGAGTIEERREAIKNEINRRFVLNDATLHEICQAKAQGFTVYERTDPKRLTLGVFTEEDANDGTLPAVGIVNEIRPTVPQNLALYAGVDTAVNRPVLVSHAHFGALWAGLGTIERHVPDYAIRGGQIGEESEIVYTSEKWHPHMVGAMAMSFGMMADGITQDGGAFRLHPDYTPIYPAYEFPQYDGTETTGQLGGGTLRLFGTNANQEVGTTATQRMSLGDLQQGSGGLITGTMQIGGVVEADTNI